MNTLAATKIKIEQDPKHWSLYVMEFVDDFRRTGDLQMLDTPFSISDEHFDALLASTAEALCDEKQLKSPEWLAKIPACRHPWFVAGVESLKAIALAESPLRFRIRKIFVLENFLART